MPREPQLPMVVIAISDRLEDVESQFLVWTRGAGLVGGDPNTDTFFGFDTIDDLNSETVIDRLLSDETDLGDLKLRLVTDLSISPGVVIVAPPRIFDKNLQKSVFSRPSIFFDWKVLWSYFLPM